MKKEENLGNLYRPRNNWEDTQDSKFSRIGRSSDSAQFTASYNE